MDRVLPEEVRDLSSAQHPKPSSKLILHPAFKDTIKGLRDVNVALPRNSIEESSQFPDKVFPPKYSKLTKVEESDKFSLDAQKGLDLISSRISIAAYDESINKFSALEGTAYLTSHALTILGTDRYLPVILLTFYFYSRSKYLAAKSGRVKYSQNPQMDSQLDYMQDKIRFLLDYAPLNSLLFVDGPLIAGDVYVRLVSAMDEFVSRGIVPVFFVKNSDSNLIVDSMPKLAGRFNSDLHWANDLLEPGERTSFYKYVDVTNPTRNAKVFCYFKSLRTSPARVEFHSSVFDLYSDRVVSIMDLVHYLMLVQGDVSNPQIRPVAIAEKYARAAIRLIDLAHLMRLTGLQPTMNQERFAW